MENEDKMMSNDQKDELEEIESETKNEIEKDAGRASHMRSEQSLCFMENAIFIKVVI